MKAYAPPKENNTDAYVKFLEKQGVDTKGTVGNQIDKMADAIKKFEGWNAGTIKENSPPLKLDGLKEIFQS